jgi:hypothetical protein
LSHQQSPRRTKRPPFARRLRLVNLRRDEPGASAIRPRDICRNVQNEESRAPGQCDGAAPPRCPIAPFTSSRPAIKSLAGRRRCTFFQHPLRRRGAPRSLPCSRRWPRSDAQSRPILYSLPRRRCYAWHGVDRPASRHAGLRSRFHVLLSAAWKRGHAQANDRHSSRVFGMPPRGFARTTRNG